MYSEEGNDGLRRLAPTLGNALWTARSGSTSAGSHRREAEGPYKF
jgi:hypothetical protein